MKSLKFLVVFVVLILTGAVSSWAAAPSPEDAITITGNSTAGQFSITYTQDPARIAAMKEFLKEVKNRPSQGMTGVVTTDSMDNVDFQIAQKDIATLGKDHAPFFMLLDEAALGIKDRVPADVSGGADGTVSGKKSKKQGMIFSTFQSAFGWFWWLHFSSGQKLLPTVIAAMANTVQNFYFTINPTIWAKYTDQFGVTIAEHIGLSRFKNSEFYRVAAQLTLSTAGNLVTNTIFQGILNPHIFLTHPLAFFVQAVGYSIANTYIASTYDSAVSHWRRVWQKTQDPALSTREVDTLMMARNVVLAAVLPLIFKNVPDIAGMAHSLIHGTPFPSMPAVSAVSWSVAIGIGTFGAFMIGKGDSFFRWVKAQPGYTRAVQLGEELQKQFHAKMKRVTNLIHLGLDCKDPMGF